MKHETTHYKGYSIQKRTDVKINSCIIYKDDKLIKCIAGTIFDNGTENSVERAKQWIDEQEMENTYTVTVTALFKLKFKIEAGSPEEAEKKAQEIDLQKIDETAYEQGVTDILSYEADATESAAIATGYAKPVLNVNTDNE